MNTDGAGDIGSSTYPLIDIADQRLSWHPSAGGCRSSAAAAAAAHGDGDGVVALCRHRMLLRICNSCLASLIVGRVCLITSEYYCCSTTLVELGSQIPIAVVLRLLAFSCGRSLAIERLH